MTIVQFRRQNEKKERKKEETNKGEEKKNEEPITPWCRIFLKKSVKKFPALYVIRILITRLEVPKTYPYSEVNKSNQRHKVLLLSYLFYYTSLYI
jgi:hypothetical protein